MNQVRKPKFDVVLNKKNVTAQITPYLSQIKYKDATEGKSDEVQLTLSNSTSVWLDEWYPDFGDTLNISIGWEHEQFDCGEFEIDEVEVSLSPDTIVMKAIAANLTGNVRTKRSGQHENQTLRQIAEKIAARNSYQLAGTIDDTGQLVSESQVMETDLGFLMRISKTYGHAFSLRGQVITFTSVYDLEAIQSAVTLTRADLRPGTTFRDKTYDTYKKVHLAHFDPYNKKVYETEFEFPEIKNVDGFAYNGIVKKDVKEVRMRADGGSQAQAKAIAALHSSNSKQQQGRLLLNGNPYVVAGNNITVTECGKLSGEYHIVSSEHTLKPGKDGGYTTEADVKRVGYVTIDKTKVKKIKKKKPIHVTVTK